MRFLLAPFLLFLTTTTPVLAADMKIAVVAPDAGNLAILGEQVREGVRLASGDVIEIVAVPESCEDDSGPAIAEQIVESGAQAAVGFLCTESLEGGLAKLAEKQIPAITLSVRASIPMEDALKRKWPLFRLAPSATAEKDKLVDTISRYWQDRPFAILDDGTINSRDLAEAVRNGLEEKGMKAAFVDTFRPAQEVQAQLIRRLLKAGTIHVFAAADRSDMAVIAREAKRAGKDFTFLGGDALNGADQDVALEKGVLAVTLPDYQTLAPAKTVVDALAVEGRHADGYILPAYAAVTVLKDAKEIADGSGAALAEALVDTNFATVIGEIGFNKSHELATNPFMLQTWDGQNFTPVLTIN